LLYSIVLFFYKKSPEGAEPLFLLFSPFEEKISHKDPICWNYQNRQNNKYDARAYS
jgi:hypothetical protein